MFPPSTRKYAAIFSEERTWQFEEATYICGATFVPIDEKNLDASFSSPARSIFVCFLFFFVYFPFLNISSGYV